MVAIAFIPNVNDLPEVNHLDRNRENNHTSNLEWITHRDNILHAIGGEKHHKSKLSDEDVKWIRDNYIRGSKEYGQVSLAKMFNVTQGTISNILTNRHRVG